MVHIEIILTFFTQYTLFSTSNTFISNTRPKLSKKLAKAKQHPEVEILTMVKMSQKRCACVNEII